MEPTSRVANYGADTVSEIEASSGTVIRTIVVGSDPGGVSADGAHRLGRELWRRRGRNGQ